MGNGTNYPALRALLTEMGVTGEKTGDKSLDLSEELEIMRLAQQVPMSMALQTLSTWQTNWTKPDGTTVTVAELGLATDTLASSIRQVTAVAESAARVRDLVSKHISPNQLRDCATRIYDAFMGELTSILTHEQLAVVEYEVTKKTSEYLSGVLAAKGIAFTPVLTQQVLEAQVADILGSVPT
jgi:hypothetical protein